MQEQPIHTTDTTDTIQREKIFTVLFPENVLRSLMDYLLTEEPNRYNRIFYAEKDYMLTRSPDLLKVLHYHIEVQEALIIVYREFQKALAPAPVDADVGTDINGGDLE